MGRHCGRVQGEIDTEERCDTCVAAGEREPDRAVQPVTIGQRQRGLT
jgi:hypothetical protein